MNLQKIPLSTHSSYPLRKIMNMSLLGVRMKLIEGMAPMSPSLSLSLSLFVWLAVPSDESSPVLVGFSDRCSLFHFLEVGQTAKFIFTLIYSISLLFSSICCVTCAAIFRNLLKLSCLTLMAIFTSHCLDPIFYK